MPKRTQILNRSTKKNKNLEKEKVIAKRVDVPIDAGLLAEAKAFDVNIEEATRKHFKKVKDAYKKE